MKKTISLLLALLMTLSLCACGSSAYNQSAATVESNGYAPGDAYLMEMDDAEFEYAGFAVSEEAAASRAGGDAPDESPDKIIYSSNVTVETTEFDDALSRLDALVKEYKGWVESSSINGANFYNRSRGYVSSRSASYTLRIPSDRFDQLMNGLSALGNVPYTHTYTENVTAQYYDVQARLTAYQTQETRLLEMMEVAETVDDIILLEDRLTELRYDIESLQSTLNNWDRRVSYSTVYLEIQEVQEYTPEAEAKLSYGQQLGRALSNGWKSVADFFRDFLLWFLEAMPTLVILGIILAAVLLLTRKSRAKRKQEREARIAAQRARLEERRNEKNPKE